MDQAFLIALIASAVTMLAATLPLLIQAKLETQKAKTETNKAAVMIKAALAAEIKGVIDATENSGLVRKLANLRQQMEMQDEVLVPKFLVQEPDYDHIFKNLGEKIGLLDLEVATRVIVFHKTVRMHRIAFYDFQGQKVHKENYEELVRELDNLENGIRDLQTHMGLIDDLVDR
ncbi:MAG: hypothetical protein AAGB04_30730 [Pseudomonadota bacterium]